MEQKDKVTENIITKETCITAGELMAKVRTDPKINIFKFPLHSDQNVILNDISLKIRGLRGMRGVNEDNAYTFNSWYRSNIRRGNTIIQADDRQTTQSLYSFFGRKGLEKFFDLRYEYIQKNLGKTQYFDAFDLNDIEKHKALHGIIFDKVLEALEKSRKILIYKLTQANGENAQISWINSLQAWLIASKNASLLARNETDIKSSSFSPERFKFACLIGKEWFRHVERIQKKGSLNELKVYMDGRTFIGEYCGNQEYQHLVKYTETDIHFFAVVENNSNATCIPPEEALGVFNKFGLTCVKHQNMGIYETWHELNRDLLEIYTDVAKASIDIEGEGSAIYMTEVDEAIEPIS